LCQGDIFPLKVGERVSADARLIKSYGLQADESSLTGESLPAIKDAEAISAETAETMELINMVFAGTLITQGEGPAVVVTTGRSTELGRVSELARRIAISICKHGNVVSQNLEAKKCVQGIGYQ
jgi:Ca2+-transporting ATPase